MLIFQTLLTLQRTTTRAIADSSCLVRGITSLVQNTPSHYVEGIHYFQTDSKIKLRKKSARNCGKSFSTMLQSSMHRAPIRTSCNTVTVQYILHLGNRTIHTVRLQEVLNNIFAIFAIVKKHVFGRKRYYSSINEPRVLDPFQLPEKNLYMYSVSY